MYAEGGATIKDLRCGLIYEKIEDDGRLPRSDVSVKFRAASRLATGIKSIISKKQFTSQDDWKAFQNIEADSTFVNEALEPLERFFRQLGTYALETVDSSLSESTQHDISVVIEMVKKIKHAIKENRIKASPEVLKRIHSANNRCPDWSELKQSYTKNIEGIVFEWEDRKLKLTGYYTPINRLLGYFKFGQNPAMII
jgi:hypothetical protein